MSSFTNQEFLDLIQKLVDEQYDDAIDTYDIDQMEWIPAEPDIKEKIHEANNAATIDLTHVKSNKIKEEILKFSNLRVGAFKIRITRYNGVPSKDGAQMALSMKAWEERTQTPSGMACRMDYPMIFAKDDRFNGRTWLKYFGQDNTAHNVPIDTVVEIVRWLQGIHKLTAFL